MHGKLEVIDNHRISFVHSNKINLIDILLRSLDKQE